MRGRKKLPQEIKNLKGTSQRCRETSEINTNKVSDLDMLLDVKKLTVLKTKRSKDIFKEKANQLIKLKILTELDFELLAIYAHNVDLTFTCINEMKKGMFKEIFDENGNVIRFVQNPYLKLYKETVERVNKIGSEFGFSPVSRMRLSTQPEKEETEFEKFLKGE